MFPHGSESTQLTFRLYLELYISMISHGSEGEALRDELVKELYISTLSHGSEGRPEKMIFLIAL